MRSRRHAVWFLGLAAALCAIVACRSVAQPGATSVAPPSDAPSSARDAGSLRENPLETQIDASIAVPASPSPAPSPPRWAKEPETSGELFSALDGACSYLHVSVLDNEALVHWGGYDSHVARVSNDAITVDAALSASIGHVHDVEYITGHWPDQTYLEASDGTRCDFGSHALRLEAGKFRSAFALPAGISVEHVQAYGGGAIGIRHCNAGCGNPDPSCVPGVFMGDNAKAPPMSGDGFRVSHYQTLPSGEVFAIGAVCKDKTPYATDCAGQFRWWSPGAKVGYLPTVRANENEGAILVRSKTEIYVRQNDYFAMFDGTKLTTVAHPGKSVRWMSATRDGLAIADESKVWQRKSDGTYDDITPPGYVPSNSGLAGLGTDTPWAFTKDAVYKRVDGAWRRVELPRPPFTSTGAYLTPISVTVRAPDDVFVIGSYFEHKPGWNEVEKRVTVLRTKRPKETLRCQAGGLGSWPAQATDACATPFVLLAPVSTTSPKSYDYPKTRSVMRAKASLAEDGALTEIRENDKVWIGMVPRSFADGRVLAELYASQFPFTRPEVVCLTPAASRKIPIN